MINISIEGTYFQSNLLYTPNIWKTSNGNVALPRHSLVRCSWPKSQTCILMYMLNISRRWYGCVDDFNGENIQSTREKPDWKWSFLIMGALSILINRQGMGSWCCSLKNNRSSYCIDDWCWCLKPALLNATNIRSQLTKEINKNQKKMRYPKLLLASIRKQVWIF